MSDVATFSDGDFSVSSTSETAEAIETNLRSGDTVTAPEKTEEERVSEAAKELGRKGGKASAEARAKAPETTDDVQARGDDNEADRGDAPSNEPPPSGKSPAHEGKDSPQARVAQVTREAKELKQALQFEKEQRARYERELEEYRRSRPAEAPAPPPADKEPDPADYDNHAQYVRDVAAYTARQEHAKFQQAEEAKRVAAQISFDVQTHMELFKDRMTEAKKADPDFESKVPDAVWDRLNPTWFYDREQWRAIPREEKAYALAADQIVTATEHPAAIVQYFGTEEGQKEFQRIATLRTREDIARVIARLDGRFDGVQGGESVATAGTNAPPPISKAPTPFRPVKGSPSAVDSEPDENAPYEEHRRYWNAQERQRSGRR